MMISTHSPTFPDRLASLVQRALDAFWLSDLAFARFAISTGSIVWAWILLVGGYQFDRLAYGYMVQMAPQEVWGYGFLFVGLLQFVRAFLGIPISSGFYSCTAAALIFFMWCSACVALYISATPPPATFAGNFAIMCLAATVLVRAIAKRD